MFGGNPNNTKPGLFGSGQQPINQTMPPAFGFATFNQFGQPIQQNNFFKGYAKQVTSFLQSEQKQTNKGSFFGYSMNQTNQPVKKQPTIRNTKLFTDQNSPWKSVPQQLKQLFSPTKIQSNLFHFPQQIDSIFPTANKDQNNLNKYIFNACTFPKIAQYYRCFTCSRTQNNSKYGNSVQFIFVICEYCFEPNQHIGHYYQKISNNPYLAYSNIICICGKDLFFENSETYRCKNHCIGQIQYQQNANINQDEIISLNSLLKILFQISFYMQRQLYCFQNLENIQLENYFAFIHKIVQNMNKIMQTDARYINLIYQFLVKQKITCYLDRYQKQVRHFGRSQTEKQQNIPLMTYFLSGFQSSNIVQTMFLIFLSNDNIASKFQQVLYSKTERNYSTSKLIQKQFNLRRKIIKYRLQNNKLFWNCIQNLKIVWLKDESHYHYANDFIKYTVYGKNQSNVWYSRRQYRYAQSMDQVITAFNGIPVGKFFKTIGPLILPQFLNCYSQAYVKQQFQNQSDEDQNQDEKEGRKKTWQQNKPILITIINNIIVSICNGSLDKISKVQQVIKELEKSYNIQNNKDEENKQQQQNQKKKKKKKNRQQTRIQQIDSNFLDFVVNVYQNKISLSSNNIFSYTNNFDNRNNKDMFQVDKIQKHKAQISYFRFNSLLISLSVGYPKIVIQKIFNFTWRSGNFHKHNHEQKYYFDNRRNSKDQKRKQIYNIYTGLKLILFYKFLLPQYYQHELRNQQQVEQDQKQTEQILKKIFYYSVKFQPHKLRVLKKRLKLRNFNELVSDNLKYNLQTKLFLFNQDKKYIDPIVQLLVEQKQGFILGQSDMQYLQKYIKYAPQSEMLKNLLVHSGIIQQSKQKLQSLFKKFGKTEGQAHEDLLTEYLYYLSYLVIANTIQKGENQLISNQLNQLKQNQQYRFRMTLTQLQKKQINKILFGIQITHQDLSIEQKGDTILGKQMIQSGNIKKQKKTKQFQQKRLNVLKRQGIPDKQQKQNQQVCVICHQKSMGQNQLIYLMKVNVNKTISTTFFKQFNVLKTNLRFCFHPLHINCYKQQINCPLCSKLVNCMIPIKFKPQFKKLNRICTNSIIVALYQSYQVYDIQNLFILLFKFLVESKVFNSLINIELYQMSKKKREKSQKFVFQYLCDMYSKCSTEQRLEFDQSVVNLMKKAEKVSKQILGKIQKLFIAAIYQKIKTGQPCFDIDEMSKLSIKMRSEEFMVIKAEAEDIQPELSTKIDKFETNIELQKQKTILSKQYPLQLPKDAQDLPNFGKPFCNICKVAGRQRICLICGFTLCRNCSYSSQHRGQHEQKALDFFFEQAKTKFNLSLSNQSQSFFSPNQKQICLYYNKLMIPYKEAVSDVPLDKNEKIQLNQTFYFGLTQMLLN